MIAFIYIKADHQCLSFINLDVDALVKFTDLIPIATKNLVKFLVSEL